MTQPRPLQRSLTWTSPAGACGVAGRPVGRPGSQERVLQTRRPGVTFPPLLGAPAQPQRIPSRQREQSAPAQSAGTAGCGSGSSSAGGARAETGSGRRQLRQDRPRAASELAPCSTPARTPSGCCPGGSSPWGPTCSGCQDTGRLPHIPKSRPKLLEGQRWWSHPKRASLPRHRDLAATQWRGPWA